MFATFFSLMPLLIAEPPPNNPLLEEVLGKGIAVAGGGAIKLPAPALHEGMDAQARKAALDKAAGRLPLNLFLKNSPNSPFTLKINSVNDAKGQRRGQTVDLWFVAYGKLSAVSGKGALNGLLLSERKPGGSQAVEYLTAEQLRERGIQSQAKPGLEERYALLDSTLLDKVQLSGVMHEVKTATPHSVVLAAKLDERFADDKKHPNRWRSVRRDSGLGESRGPPQPYAGFGGYVRVTELPEPAGALFVEMHFVFHEPKDWFGGPNLLRSKLPVLIQDNVRAFRRKLTRD
jgi:hypothetical protein